MAGARSLGAAFLAEVPPFVYRRTIAPALVESVRSVKRKITRQLVARRQRGFHVKLGTGGIREVEFFCQTLQILHAGRNVALRERNTFRLLDQLLAAGLIDDNLHASQLADYRLLRRIEHRLQMVEDRQTHQLPPEAAGRVAVARGLGFPDLDAFDAHLTTLRDRVHLLFQSLFAREESEEARARRERLTHELTARLPFVDRSTAAAVLTYWPEEELAAPAPTAVADGFALLSALSEVEPVVAHIVDLGLGRYQLRLAAVDTTGLVAVSTGTLAGFGLDIQDGALFTLPRGRYWGREQGPWALQYLTVTPAGDARLAADQRDQVAARVVAWATRWVAGERDAVRAQVTTHWVAALRRRGDEVAPGLSAVDVEIDNRTDPDASAVYLWGADAPGFLHAFALGLAMRSIRIRDLKVRTDGHRVVDCFHLTDAGGRKIITASARHEIEVLALLIHGFAYCLAAAADPALALTQFDTLLDHLSRGGAVASLRVLEAGPLLAALATILGSGTHLFEDFLRLAPRHLLPVVAAVAGGGPPSPLPVEATGSVEERREALVAWRDAELFRIDCDHLLHPDHPFGRFGEALSRLADQVVTSAWELALEEAGLTEGVWAVFGLGKLGGRELGYASDLELLFVYRADLATAEDCVGRDAPHGLMEGGSPPSTGGEASRTCAGRRGGRVASPSISGQAAVEAYQRAVRALLRSLPARREGIFEIDLRLRPHGKDGPLACSAAAFARYYRPGGGAAPFERQALIRLRPIVGDPVLIQEILAARDRFTYGPEPFDLALSAELRRRQIKNFVPAGATHLKYGRGGLVEVEYAIQYRQIALGGAHRSLRRTNLLEAIAALERLGDLGSAEAARLRGAYTLLRRVIDAVRLERGNARDLLLPEPGSPPFDRLARRLGRDPAELATEVTETMAWVAERYARAVGGGAGTMAGGSPG